jgi:ketosteroid isomerase-like protein
MASEQVEREVVEAEKQFWQSMVDKDADTAMRLTDDVCLLTGAQGASSFPKQAFEKMMDREGYTLHRFELKEPKVLLLRDDVAVVAYQVHEELTVDGKPVTVDAADASTWVRKGGRWVCALHTESILGDPYGRDRRH